MQIRPISDTPSQIIVEQLVASGVKYVFNNSGSREALFFDALYSHPDIHDILGLHEGVVAGMAGGYTQANLDPAVMVVHLGAGLAQCLGQLINVWYGGLPVVVITFAGDTGSFGDRVGLDLSYDVGPTFISGPFTKANWTVPEACPRPSTGRCGWPAPLQRDPYTWPSMTACWTVDRWTCRKPVSACRRRPGLEPLMADVRKRRPSRQAAFPRHCRSRRGHRR